MADPIVKIIWFDSHMMGEPWNDRDEAVPDTASISTVGFLLRSEEDWITVYQSVDNDRVQGVFHIPRGCVREVVPL